MALARSARAEGAARREPGERVFHPTAAAASATRQQRTPAPILRFGPAGRTAPRIRLLIADDHALLRQALRVLLNSHEGIEVVGEATNGRGAVEAAARLQQDVVLMDLVMPGLNGIDATRQIVRNSPSTRVVVLSAYLEDERVVASLRAGAAGYVMKNADSDELVEAIRAVYRGTTFFSAAVTEGLEVDDLLLQARRPEARTGYDLLTAREREVLQLIAEGYSNQAIGQELVISVKTVEAHRAHIMVKLHARNRTDLIRYAIRHGLVTLEGADLALEDEPPPVP